MKMHPLINKGCKRDTHSNDQMAGLPCVRQYLILITDDVIMSF